MATLGLGLTRPEIAVLTAYGKLELDAEIVAGQSPDDPYFEETLVRYFPAPLAVYEDEMSRHRLRREIISTILSNEIVNMCGATFGSRLKQSAECGSSGWTKPGTPFPHSTSRFRQLPSSPSTARSRSFCVARPSGWRGGQETRPVASRL